MFPLTCCHPLPGGRPTCSPSTNYGHKAREIKPDRLPRRARRDQALKPEIHRVWTETFQVYGVRKVWRRLKRERFGVAHCTVERLMGVLGRQGAVGAACGKPCKTTLPDDQPTVRRTW